MLGRSNFALRKCILRRKSAEEDGVGRSACADWWCAALLPRSGNARWGLLRSVIVGRGGLAGQDAGENGVSVEDGADAAGKFAK